MKTLRWVVILTTLILFGSCSSCQDSNPASYYLGTKDCPACFENGCSRYGNKVYWKSELPYKYNVQKETDRANKINKEQGGKEIWVKLTNQKLTKDIPLIYWKDAKNDPDGSLCVGGDLGGIQKKNGM